MPTIDRESDELDSSRYDGKAKAYDAVVGLELYNRLMWGVSRREYEAFAREAADFDRSAPLIDLGCGSLRFTAEAYAKGERNVTLVDGSQAMLRLAQARWAALELPQTTASFVQADLVDSRSFLGAFRTVCLFGMLHLFADLAPVLAAAKRLLATDGRVYASAIVVGERPFSDRYRSALERAGEMGPGRTVKETADAFVAAGLSATVRTKGAFAFIVAE